MCEELKTRLQEVGTILRQSGGSVGFILLSNLSLSTHNVSPKRPDSNQVGQGALPPCALGSASLLNYGNHEPASISFSWRVERRNPRPGG